MQVKLQKSRPLVSTTKRTQYQLVPQDPEQETVITNQPTHESIKLEEFERRSINSPHETTTATPGCNTMQGLQCLTGNTGDNSGQALHNKLAECTNLQEESEKQTKKDDILQRIQLTTDINYQDSQGYTQLMLAIATQDLEIVKAISDRNPQLKLTNHLGRTALHEAASLDNTEILPLLLPTEHNYFLCLNPLKTHSIDQPDSIGYSPLLISINCNNRAMAKALIELGANSAQKDQNGRTALHFAAMYGSESCIETLLQDSHTVIGDTDKFKRTALHYACRYACRYGYAGIVEKIISSDQLHL